MQLLHQASGHLEVHLVIIHYQNIRLFDAEFLFLYVFWQLLSAPLIFAEGSDVDHVLPDPEGKSRALSIYAFYIQ